MKEQEVSEGDTRSSNRSVIPELVEGSPADSKHTLPAPDPNGVAQPHKYKNSQKNKKFHLLGRTFFNSKTSYNTLTIKTIQIISCLWCQRYKIWMELTTIVLEVIIFGLLFMMSKIQNLNGTHNLWPKQHICFMVVYDVKDTKFEWNSQHPACYS